MPYEQNRDLPEAVRSVLPEAAQSIWRNAFNAAAQEQQLSEERAFQVAWGAVENAGYKKGEDGIWRKESNVSMASMISVLRAIGDKGEADVKVLFDTGAGMSFVLRSVADRIATMTKLPRPVRITLGDGKTTATITEGVNLLIEAAGQQIMDTFIILETALNDIILGESTMRKFGLKIDLERSVVFSEIKAKEMPMWKKFLAALGINVSEEVTEEKAVALVKEQIEKKAEPPKLIASAAVLGALELPETATEAEVKGKILALKNPGNVVSREEHEKLLGRMHEQEIEQAVNHAIGVDKKLYPHEREWALGEAKKDLAAFKAFVANRPVVLPIGDKLPEKKDAGLGAAKIDDAQAEMNRQLGVSQETFLKYAQ